MDHKQYHSVRKAAHVYGEKEGDLAPLAAIVASGERMYHSVDWTNWTEDEQVVFGILTGLQLCQPEHRGALIRETNAWRLCVAILHEEASVVQIANLVWEDF